MLNPRLNVVIHAEEEFDWNKGFYQSNCKVTHGNELINIINEIIKSKVKVTLAMDYAFINSQDGIKVTQYYQSLINKQIEFAAHLHPWNNPPFKDDQDKIKDEHSFPGNLEKEEEFAKLAALTDKIEQTTGTRPTTYLAGRYGIGENTYEILQQLGYNVDLSISSYCDFSLLSGPDFSSYTNKIHKTGSLIVAPHTCSFVSPIKLIDNYFNENPNKYSEIKSHQFSSILFKCLRLKKHRLSPEGFSFDEMKKITQRQMAIGQRDFILSFHSPSIKVGLTPYVNSDVELNSFKKALIDYINWFNNIASATSFLPNELTYQPKLAETELVV